MRVPGRQRDRWMIKRACFSPSGCQLASGNLVMCWCHPHKAVTSEESGCLRFHHLRGKIEGEKCLKWKKMLRCLCFTKSLCRRLLTSKETKFIIMSFPPCESEESTCWDRLSHQGLLEGWPSSRLPLLCAYWFLRLSQKKVKRTLWLLMGFKSWNIIIMQVQCI